MSAEIVTKVQDMKKKKKRTRAAIGNYTKTNLIELSEIIEKKKKKI